MDGVAYLLHESYAGDGIGQHIPDTEKRKIFVTEGPVTRSEWFNAGQKGMNPEIRLTTAAVNYSGETVVEYKGVRYGIYRTFRREDCDMIELYLHRKGGVQCQ